VALSFKELTVWQRSVQLSVAVYRLTAGFPREEIYGISSQMRRAGVSIASNIAERWGRQTRRDFRNFLAIARGSNSELQTQLVIAGELGFGERVLRDHVLGLSEEVGKMLVAFMQKLDVAKTLPPDPPQT
jgi:four helix bundle protein